MEQVETKVDVLADYIVPVSIDHAGRYPSKRPGAVWFEELNGRRFRMELVGNPYDRRPGYDPNWGSTVLCDCQVREVRA